MAIKIHEHLPLLESILGERAQVIGSQFEPYKNHVYRVLNFCFAFHEGQGDDQEKLIIAACFHDLGMWPGDIVDYLAPSIALAQDYLLRRGKREWSAEISEMIDLHHRFRRVRNSQFPLVEVFRKGDWVDATQGLRRFGLPRADVKAVQSVFANLGFHKNLMRLAWAEFKRHPLNPLPMMKW
jgi:HD domain